VANSQSVYRETQSAGKSAGNATGSSSAISKKTQMIGEARSIPAGDELHFDRILEIVNAPNASAEKTGSRIGERFFIGGNGPIEIGKAATNQIIFEGNTVSRRHCALVRSGNAGDWELRDLKSTNGLYINGGRIDRQVLRPGSAIRIGEFELKYLANAMVNPNSTSNVAAEPADEAGIDFDALADIEPSAAQADFDLDAAHEEGAAAGQPAESSASPSLSSAPNHAIGDAPDDLYELAAAPVEAPRPKPPRRRGRRRRAFHPRSPGRR
jgi:pSer/pThr/pTyr-binding forkhead associated (FHA) protein